MSGELPGHETKEIFKATASFDLRVVHEIAVDKNQRELDNELVAA
jgi:hypothetical protein